LKQEFLSKAEENLKSAQLNFDNEFYNACSNRAYYAAFQAAIAALSVHGIISDKNEHSWVQSEFNLQLIKKRKIYPDRLKTYLLKMQEIRNIADYSDENISKKIARRQLSQATEMIQNIEKELKSI